MKRSGKCNIVLRFALSDLYFILGRPTLPSEVGIIVCDINNSASLDEMAKQTTLVLNCVGPYRFFGEPVVKACIENRTSCIDISGEPQFLELMYWKYHEKAAEKGVYIIGSTGFDSIPADLGVIYTRNKMNGTLTAVESFLTINSGPEGLCIHDGTWKSAIYGFAAKNSLKKLRNASCLKPVPVIGQKLKKRWPISFCKELSTYTIPFWGSDTSVVRRTQRYLHEYLEEPPLKLTNKFQPKVGSRSSIWLCVVHTHFLLPLLLFSAEAGYAATPIAMVQAAMTLLNDVSDLPKGGGVFTPGAAFSRTRLIDRLNQHGIEFSVISSSEV
ncbi:PREDICTED: saccharopine dehydrogenase-like oxidoreductase [Dipodomys ordii]|uniref:Saccharopine dehydrogenase-like oxidoreductase n=1 Tax=Dipodomys ordii TaxID=10020 RepID=A0A1S3F862_DIPOR|nr:PREDICTED: saccharopine dehydrogenase-like oxidoreductase [Dipodomys ordii]